MMNKGDLLRMPALFLWKPKEVDIAKCWEFANASDVRLYLRRGAKAIDNIRSNVACGKLAEMCAAEYFISLSDGTASEASASVIGPCFRQLRGSQKSWAADITTIGGLGIHCKSTTIGSALRWGLSWVFERNDRLLREPQPPTEIGAFLLVTETDVRLLAIREIETVKPLLKPLKNAHFQSKCALYASDIL